MNTHTDKTTPKRPSAAAGTEHASAGAFGFGNRSEKPSQAMAAGSTQPPVQKKENKTGLPDGLKSGIETLSGFAMDDVQVHYNSAQPAQLQAHAYAQGTHIHVAPGQEQHLPHEAWHVVQQKQGRVKPSLQKKGWANLNNDRGLENEADHMGQKAAQLQSKNPANNPGNDLKQASPTPTIQRKEETELKAGVFNMIGETHTDYPDKHARMYEATKIKEVLGADAGYFTESMLKTNPRNAEYSDPVHLRLEQVITFMKDQGKVLLPDLKKAVGVKLDQAVVKNTQGKADARLIVQTLGPKIANDGITKEAIMVELQELLADKEDALSLLMILGESNFWNFNTVYDGDTGTHSDKFFDLLGLIDDERYEREDALSSSGDEEEDAAVKEVDPLELAKSCLFRVREMYATYKGRLPHTLKLFYHMDLTHYTEEDGHFHFAVDKVKPVLKEWDKFETLEDIIKTIFSKDRNDLLKVALETSHRILTGLIKALDAGMTGAQNRKMEDVRVARSKAMHQAAETLKGEVVAWKVGNLHVEDIKKLQEEAKIPEPGYAYITKENFKAEYIDADEMKAYKGTDDDLGAGYATSKKEQNTLIGFVEEHLKKPMPWDDNFDFGTIEHLNFGNVITNQTEAIVQAVESGLMAKLKKLTIHEQSMTPELRGRLLRCNVEVVLVR